MNVPAFRQLNDGWNANPNAPEPAVEVTGRDVLLRFSLNVFLYPLFSQGDTGMIRFTGCSRYRLGDTNDHGWYLGQCRYSKIAPAWGEFYELIGPDDSIDSPIDWVNVGGNHGTRHFLFYFRDETFECLADGWTLEPIPANALFRVVGTGP
jgi:hypothetical protein